MTIDIAETVETVNVENVDVVQQNVTQALDNGFREPAGNGAIDNLAN